METIRTRSPIRSGALWACVLLALLASWSARPWWDCRDAGAAHRSQTPIELMLSSDDAIATQAMFRAYDNAIRTVRALQDAQAGRHAQHAELYLCNLRYLLMPSESESWQPEPRPR